MARVLKPCLASAACLVALGCSSRPSIDYLALPYSSVQLECHDGYMVYNDAKAKKAVVVPYLISEMAYAACAAGETQPLATRARLVVEKQIGEKCHVTSQAEVSPMQHEFAYACSA
ncbi:hypothetical protein QNA08_01860 [Chelatococcus sp. SYSU_G07232]|uniref:Lipoprotein n=1 Tax=Chelatococcus albus TaxID=3047466 RepID=A0ABT7AEE3_9HYPH|nr:hypothetical protein [Chelatococcus sp. SYSU_G07232]MDJ1156986.1 hypothetical protein [Chelatococcus sp. SYSU_G07232]